MKVSVGIDYLQSFSSLSLPAFRLQICVILVMGSEEIRSEKLLSRLHNLPVFQSFLYQRRQLVGPGSEGASWTIFVKHISSC